MASSNVGRDALLPGTLDLLVLKTLAQGRAHGYGIAEHLSRTSNQVLQVGESSLYPALQRLLLDGYVRAEWGISENNRRARYYTLTAAGRRQLVTEREGFERMVIAIQQVLAHA
jgi:PadR family transcriptional regulator, regulatory protein PadR